MADSNKPRSRFNQSTPPSKNLEIETSDDSLAAHVLKRVLDRISPHCGGLYHEVPDHQKNDFIMSGYRLNFRGITDCFKFGFSLHNETVNIWTHLLAGLFFVYQAIDFAISIKNWNLEDIVVLIAICGCIWCMAASVWFHLCVCISCPAHFGCLLRADFAGILFVIFTLYFALVSLVFGGRNAALQGLYTLYALAGGIIGCLPLTVTHLSKWQRVALVVFGFSSGVPISHFVAIATPEELSVFSGPMVVCAVSFTIGVFIYFLAIPERFFPGRFDIWGHSHQWWHICVFGGLQGAVQTLLALHALRRHHEYNFV